MRKTVVVDRSQATLALREMLPPGSRVWLQRQGTTDAGTRMYTVLMIRDGMIEDISGRIARAMGFRRTKRGAILTTDDPISALSLLLHGHDHVGTDPKPFEPSPERYKAGFSLISRDL